MRLPSLFAEQRQSAPQITRAEAPAPYSRRRERAAAYAAWVADGRPWPPPAGMLSAIMQPFMPRRGRK